MSESKPEIVALNSERPPLSEFYKLIEHVTIFKSKKWWEAVVLIESFGRRSVALYLWEFRDDKWKRKHKFNFRSTDEWAKVKNSVEQLLPKLSQRS